MVGGCRERASGSPAVNCHPVVRGCSCPPLSSPQEIYLRAYRRVRYLPTPACVPEPGFPGLGLGAPEHDIRDPIGHFHQNLVTICLPKFIRIADFPPSTVSSSAFLPPSGPRRPSPSSSAVFPPPAHRQSCSGQVATTKAAPNHGGLEDGRRSGAGSPKASRPKGLTPKKPSPGPAEPSIPPEGPTETPALPNPHNCAL